MLLFRIPFNLARMVIRLAFSFLWLPIHLVTRHLFATFLVIAFILIYAQFQSSSDQKADQALPKAPPPTLTVDPQLQGAPIAPSQKKQAKLARIDPVMKEEDGDSAFASDLYGAMTDAERTYYSQLFFWVMNTMQDGKPYTWNHFNIDGTLEPMQSFQNRLGQRCRTFREVLKVHTVRQSITGTACDNGGSTWCKLKPNATPVCGLGHEPSTFDGIKQSLKKIF
jgi:surface antigen